ncbi:MAG TPA: tryptophan synthase subunit alpha [Elusimicrobiota bacterium]|nr:tryptophan synthase subunit alpha [Elusimicrobiota bacterium]
MTLRAVMDARRARGRAAFIPYLTAGDTSLAATGRICGALRRVGADIVELGVPFSDPIADGPVNQRAAERALRSGTTLAGILDFAAAGGGAGIPAVLFTYLNPILAMGLEAFARRAKLSGIAGVLAVDLPPEEAGEYRRALTKAGLETIFLASPTTSAERLRAVGAASTGFVYCVSRLGVTGARASMASGLEAEVARVRRAVRRPVAVGFGISTPAQAGAVGRFADGVVVGSAIVRLIEEAPSKAPARVERFARSMVAAMEKSA